MNLLRIYVAGCLLLLVACNSLPSSRVGPARELWIDLLEGDQVSDEDVFDDLAKAGVVYVGEYHSIVRHHDIQLWLLQELFRRDVPLVLCLEQLEATDQPAVDRYVNREIDFTTLARDIDWTKKWRGYLAYQALCEFARQHRIPIHAMNAPAATIRAVSRGGGLANLPAEQRAHLPTEITLDDPVYERLANLELAVHPGMSPKVLRAMFEAQVARDESMAVQIVAARGLVEGRRRTALVVLGAGHVRYGLGTAARVRRRDPTIVERIVLMSESGQLQLSAAELAAAESVSITHSQLREIGRPPGDYIRVLPLAHASGPMKLPPGHPPVRR